MFLFIYADGQKLFLIARIDVFFLRKLKQPELKFPLNFKILSNAEKSFIGRDQQEESNWELKKLED